MQIFAQALALFDAFAAAGCPLVADDRGVGPALADPPAALDAALQAFVGPGEHWAGSTPRRALAAVVRAQDRAARELLAWPVALSRMPEPYTVEIARKGVCALFTTHGATWHAQVARQPCFVARELDAIAAAHELGRATPRALDGWIAQKQRSPRWVLSPDLAGAVVQGGTPAPRATFGELCDALGAELVRVTVHELAAVQGAA